MELPVASSDASSSQEKTSVGLPARLNAGPSIATNGITPPRDTARGTKMLSPLANDIAHADITSVNSGMEVGDNALQRPLLSTIRTVISLIERGRSFKGLVSPS